MDTNDAQVRRSPQPGDKVGRYCIGQRLATGGMNEVYEASDPQAPTIHLVLKVPKPGSTPKQYEFDAQHLHLEYQALTAVNGSVRIVDAVDYLDVDHGGPALIEERIAGSSLRDVLVQGVTQMRPESAAEIILQVLHGLEDLRSHEYAHGDIKPKNIMLRSWPHSIDVVLIDLGTAEQRAASDAVQYPQARANTQTYSSPERNENGGPPSSADDVYASGVVLTEMLTGTLPVRGTDDPQPAASEDEATRSHRAPNTSDTDQSAELRAELERIALRARAPLANRYQTADAMIHEIERACDDSTRRYDGDSKSHSDSAVEDDTRREADTRSKLSRRSPRRSRMVWPGDFEEESEDRSWRNSARIKSLISEFHDEKNQFFSTNSTIATRRATRRRAVSDNAIRVFNSSLVSSRKIRAEAVINEEAERLISSSILIGSILGIIIGGFIVATIVGLMSS